jgi:hypothetical protein
LWLIDFGKVWWCQAFDFLDLFNDGDSMLGCSAAFQESFTKTIVPQFFWAEKSGHAFGPL